MINNVAHHFTPAQNVELAQRVVRALAPSGIYSAGEFLCTTNDKVNDPYRIEMPPRMVFPLEEAIDALP
jgi:hypothetical protein